MNFTEISDSVKYIGVNDHRDILFESLWKIPNGVSYNSYMVKGLKVALIDSVESEFFEEFNNHLTEDGIIPDYIVVNHMEPDHSGSLPKLVALYPALKIVGNRQTVNMIKGFYHIDDDSRYIIVKDGDILDLGDSKVLKFYLTPMVHWPETMMTWFESEQVLFSADAFGCFGALAGGVVDTSFDTEPYFKEMLRYYAAIVGKYGRNVQSALKKLASLPIKFICSTHGPVWNQQATRVVALYERLSKYEAYNHGVVIVYGSMYGNTEKAVELLAEELTKNGFKEIRIHNASNADLSDILSDVWKYDNLVIASPTYSMDIFPPVEAFVKAIEVRELRNRKIGLLGSYTWAPEALKKLTSRIENMDVDLVGTASVKMSLNEASSQEIVALADAMSSSNN